jgi:hypothetical protein
MAGTLKKVPVFLHIKYSMQIVFSNDKKVDIILNSTSLALTYQKIYKHLSHVPVPFREWDSPYYVRTKSIHQIVEKLILYANKVSVKIDRQLCELQDQEYLNNLHRIYEKNYNGNPDWLDFHEHIHMCEKTCTERANVLNIDYREKAGMLEKPFDLAWLTSATTKVKTGDVYIKWAELGKTPYVYWANNEPETMTRMCELAKPWLKLRPKIIVALEDIDFLKGIDVPGFETWWIQYSIPWCQYWQIPSWGVSDIFGASVFGRVPDFTLIAEQLQNNMYPTRVLL